MAGTTCAKHAAKSIVEHLNEKSGQPNSLHQKSTERDEGSTQRLIVKRPVPTNNYMPRSIISVEKPNDGSPGMGWIKRPLIYFVENKKVSALYASCPPKNAASKNLICISIMII
jgi:hypothetical protein